MWLRPVDSAAALALGKAIVTRKDVRRYPQTDEFARDRYQKMIALRASRERSRARVEPEPDHDFAQLLAKRVALDEHDVAPSPQPLVARNQDSSFYALYS